MCPGYTCSYWSDYACPYCYTGETRLKNAIASLGLDSQVDVEMKAFELNPDASYEVVGSTLDRIATSDGSVELDVLHVPGHTDDSCALYCKEAGLALVGDTVYEDGPRLTVFPTGNPHLLRASIQNKLLALPDDTLLLSGHSRPMTIGQLRRVMWEK